MNIADLKIEYLPIGELEAYENNTRKHNVDDVEQIAKSIRRYGFSDPIGIWSDHNVIVEGHGRLMAAKSLGLDRVPCIRLDHLTDEQRREYGIMHNKTAELSEWDFDMLEQELADLDLSEFGLDFTPQEQETVYDTEEELLASVEEDETPEPVAEDAPTRVHTGELWQLGEHFLYCGDSTDDLDIDKMMDGTHADLVVTDPPYNVAIENSNGLKIKNDNMASEMFYDFLRAAFEQMERVLRPGGAYYVWFATREHMNFEQALRDNNLAPRQELVWVKNALVLGHSDYQWRHEPCLYGVKAGGEKYFVHDRTQTTVIDDTVTDFSKLKKEEMQRLLEDIYNKMADIPQTVIYEKKPLVDDLHPTMKPVKLIARQIRNSSRPGETVVDLFGGSGTTLIACEQLGRKCRTIELDERYASVIVERWEKYTGKKAKKVR